MPAWLAFLIGLFVGNCVGFMICGLMAAATDVAHDKYKMVNYDKDEVEEFEEVEEELEEVEEEENE